MKITVKNNSNNITKTKFKDIETGDVFFDLNTGDSYIKLYGSHGEADGVAFSLEENLDFEFEDDEKFGIYSSAELILTK
jgi:hypothetical protein